MATVTGDTGFTVSGTLSASVPVTLICPPGRIAPYPPTLRSVAQATAAGATVLAFGVAQNVLTGAYPIASFKLYRGSFLAGPFSLACDFEPISPATIVTQLFDAAPIFGVQEYYVATAIDSDGNESGPSNVLFYSASIASTIPPSTISAAAFGPYPVLGSDVFLDPTTGEGVVGPNGDLLTVNGLACLAQDLRIRLLTELGELPMHQTFGFTSGIGGGQANQGVQAAILVANVKDMLRQEPRVAKTLSVSVYQSDAYSWIITYDIMAINVEDAARLNMVYNYYGQAA